MIQVMRRGLFGVSFIVSLFLTSTLFAAQDTGWELVRDRNAVLVHEMQRPGNPLPIFRGRTVIKASVWEILAVLRDTPRKTEWVHRCAESRVVRHQSETDFYIYRRTDAPWPFADRDVVVHSVVTMDDEAGIIHVAIESVDLPEEPHRSDYVRMPNLKGHYRFKILAAKETAVEYLIDADPGGSLPDWLIRLTSRDIPYYTLSGLTQRVFWAQEQGLYRNSVAMIRGLN